MKTIKMLSSIRLSGVITASIIIVVSCQPDPDILNSVDTQNVNSEAASAAFVNENADIVSMVMNNLDASQYASKTIGDSLTISNLASVDGRLACASVSVKATGTVNVPSGTINIFYSSTGGCVDFHNVSRRGKIVITYQGVLWQPSSYYTIEFQNFYRNAARIEGKDSVVFEQSLDPLALELVFVSYLRGGRITFSDGRSIEREHTLTKTWYRSADPKHPENDELHVEGWSTGKNKNGNHYHMSIDSITPSPLIQKMLCWIKNKIYIPVQGSKTMRVSTSGSERVYNIDFGDGGCDNQVKVTINGKEKLISVTNDGN